MGWTDAVSASPLSSGIVECGARLPFLAQYMLTVAAPALASVAAACIVVTVSGCRAVRRRPRLRVDVQAWRAALQAWWAEQRALSTCLFVLTLLYMPITASSLRVLDCSPPIDGVQYLRGDLRVVCYEGPHAVARIVAYLVLVFVGAGFPCGLALMLVRKTPAQRAAPAFQHAWSFLFSGYRVGAEATDSAPVQQGSACGRRLPSFRRAPNAVWWESLVLLRKAGIVLLSVLVVDPYLQTALLLVLLVAALVLHLLQRPYTDDLFNRLEAFSLGTCVLTSMLSAVLLESAVLGSNATVTLTGMGASEWAVTVLLCLLNLGAFAVLALTWAALRCRSTGRAVVRSASRVAVLSKRISKPATRSPFTSGPIQPHGATRQRRVAPSGGRAPLPLQPEHLQPPTDNPLLRRSFAAIHTETPLSARPIHPRPSRRTLSPAVAVADLK
jgi:hypothetical protein